MPLPLHKLFLSLLIFSLYPLSLLAYPLVIVLSQDDLKDPSSSRDGGPANVVVGGGDSSWWEDDSDAKPDDELDPGSWRPIFEPDSDSSEPKTEEEALYYSGVTKMISAVSSGDPRAMKEAASEIEAAAVGGNPHAQSVLGFLYQTGMMREWNRMKAFMYHCFAADGGNVQSRMALAYDYSRQDIYDKAAKLYAELAEIAVTSVVNSKVSTMIDPVRIHHGAEENKLALRRGGEEDEGFQILEYQAQKGYADAMYKLGLFYYYGLRGVRCDHAKAFSWFLKAVEKGEPRSMELLGEMYARGAGVERNYTKALEWLRLASKQQICSAYNGMGYLYVRGFGVEKNYTKAKEYFEIAAENDDADGNYNLGVMYLKGIGVKGDVKQACEYFIVAANLGQQKAFYQLAKMFHTGVGLKKNLPMATALYKLVAEKGPWSSLSRWALEAYLKGDVGTAFLLYSRMAELGYEVAQSNAAWILDKYGNHSMCMGESGLCTDAERHQREHSLWWQASKQGNEYASLLIRDAYHHGRVPGVLRDYDHAPEAYTQCKSQSNATKGDGCGLIEKV